MTTTTSYGTWCNRVNTYSLNPDFDIVDYIGGGDSDWRELIEESGALDRMIAAYRNAIEEALPPGISLCGDEFIGPAYPDDDEFDGYPTDDFGNLDFKAMVEDIDVQAIVEYYEPVTLEDIGRHQLKSNSANPAKRASTAMSRLGLKPFAYRPHPESGRPQALFLSGEVTKALAARPGRGRRSEPKGQVVA